MSNNEYIIIDKVDKIKDIKLKDQNLIYQQDYLRYYTKGKKYIKKTKKTIASVSTLAGIGGMVVGFLL